MQDAVEELLRTKPRSFEHAVIYRVSVAAAPLAAWVKANLEYSRVLRKIAPLEQQNAQLQAELESVVVVVALVVVARLLKVEAQVISRLMNVHRNEELEYLGRQFHSSAALALRSVLDLVGLACKIKLLKVTRSYLNSLVDTRPRRARL